MKIVTIGLFILIEFAITSFGQTTFEFGINSEEDCIVWEAAIDNFGSVILVGIIGSYVGPDYDAFVMKVSLDGSYTTKHFYQQDAVSAFSNIEILANGNYLSIGSYSPIGNMLERDHLWIVILDPELNLISEKTYKIREPYIGFGTSACSIIDNDGNIVLASIALVEESDEKTAFADFAFYKFNQQGDTLLSKYYSYIWDEWSWELRQMPNSDNLMLIERSTHYNGHEELLYLDPAFNILNINQFGNIDYLISGDLSSDYWVSDTSFLLSGRNSWDMGTYHEYYIGVYLVDTSAVFHQELVLNKNDTVDYPAWRNSMAYANDSTIYIGGFQSLMSLWTTDPNIVELYMIDKNMNLLGYKELGGDAFYEVWGIIATDDDGCLVYGIKCDNDTVFERDVYIWKVLRDDINIITELSESKEEIEEISIFPNPVIDHIYIHLDQKNNWDKLTLSIFNLDGKKLFQKQITGDGNLLKTDLHNLMEGLYIIRISNADQIIYSEKILKK